MVVVNSEEKECQQRIYTAIIASRSPGSSYIDQRIHYHVNHFRHSTFTGQPGVIGEMRLWPPIMAYHCTQNETVYDKGHGSNLVHYEIWDDFYKQHRGHRGHPGSGGGSSGGSSCGGKQAKEDVLLIFEYDAYLGSEHAVQSILEGVSQMQTDFLFLGYCFKRRQHPRLTNRSPYCLHAYAITISGAKKLTDLLDICGPFADAQLSNFFNDGLISWSYLNTSYDSRYVERLFQTEGLYMSGYFLYDGVVIQAKYDDLPGNLSEGTIGHKGHDRQLFCLYHNQWRPIENMAMFERLKGDHRRVKSLSHWQFNHWQVNWTPLTTEECDALVKIRSGSWNGKKRR